MADITFDDTLAPAGNFSQTIADRIGANIASASTISFNLSGSLSALAGTHVITGTTPITAVTLTAGRLVRARFAGALTLTHGASLILPAAADITTAAGDIAFLLGEASGVVRCVAYTRADGTAIVGSATNTLVTASVSAAGNGTALVTGPINTVAVTAAAGAGVYTYVVTLPVTTGPRIALVTLDVAASTNPTIEVRNLTSGGTLLFTMTGTVNAGVANLIFYFNGTNWVLTPGSLIAFET